MPRDFYIYLASRFTNSAGLTMLRSAVMWHVYDISRSSRDLGLVGIVQFIPALFLTLLGGAVADTYDRKRIIAGAQVVLLVVGTFLYEATRRGAASLPVLFGSVLLISSAGAFESPARTAILPGLVPREVFPRAVTISSTNHALAFATGPALGGLIIWKFGIEAAYASFLILMTVAFALILMLRFTTQHTGPKRSVSLAAIGEGLRFVWSRPVVLGCMTLDMFAVIFGGATALLPIYAHDILKVGAQGYGFLNSSLEIGALSMSLLLMLRPTVRRAGTTLLIAVALYGLATIVFGLSRSFPLSVVAYMAAGMADQVSVVMRSTAIQLSTPDELRGRVSSVNMLFIGASNQLGAAESGFVASWTDPVFAVVSGGAACLLVVLVVALRLPELRRYEIQPVRISG